jgi:hypothetical protein
MKIIHIVQLVTFDKGRKIYDINLKKFILSKNYKFKKELFCV